MIYWTMNERLKMGYNKAQALYAWVASYMSATPIMYGYTAIFDQVQLDGTRK